MAGTLLRAAVDGRYDLPVSAAGDPEPERVRAIVGHLARAGVVRPAPAPIDRLRGRVLGAFDGRARATCRSSAGDAQRARWRQYRAVWAFVEGAECRRAAILRHFGDRAQPHAEVPCCDVCAPELVPAAPAPRAVAGGRAGGRAGDLDAAIVDVVTGAEPSVGRTRTVEILRGGRSQVVRKNAYDGLPSYGTFAHLRADEVLARVDELLDEGRLVSTGGAYPKLRVGRRSCAAEGEPDERSASSPRARARTSRRCSTASTAARSRSSPWPAISPRRARSSAPGRRACRRGSSCARSSGRAPRATPPWPTGSSSRASSSWCSPATWRSSTPAFVARFPDRILNVHPSLLPAFPGVRAIEQAVEHGVKVFGVTVHLVDEGVDTGPIVLQRAVELPDARDPGAVRATLRPIEHELLPRAVALMAAGRLRRDPAHPRRVLVDEEPGS